jgi:hypothetical protein
MKNLEEFKKESLEINEKLSTHGGATANDNSKGMRSAVATEVSTAHPSGEDSKVTYANDDWSVGDTFLFRIIHPD